jgi:hypothetical protein
MTTKNSTPDSFIVGELVSTTTRQPVEYAMVQNQSTFDQLVELFGEDHIITQLIKELRKVRNTLELTEGYLLEHDTVTELQNYQYIWKTGIPKVEGWYWFRTCLGVDNYEAPVFHEWFHGRFYTVQKYLAEFRPKIDQWAGPINMPKEIK